MTLIARPARPPAAASDLAIAGITPFSTVDWPGSLVATVFAQGCPWECAYCHNPDLMDTRAPGTVPWDDVAAILERRRGLLDGVVFSGGEPTRQAALLDAAVRVREAGFAVGLHTGGAFPIRLEALLPLVDWVALDVKAPRSRYGELTGRAPAGERAWTSLELILESGIDYELRTTVDPVNLALADVEQIAAEVAELGATPPVLQEARPEGARAAWAAALGGARLDDVVPRDALPHLERRYAA